MIIKKHDFIEIEYTGILKADQVAFDTTSEAEAKKHHIHRPSTTYGPLTVCVGEHFLLKGLDDFLVGKEVGKQYTIDLTPEQGFGKKDAKLVQMIPMSKFNQSKLNPFPGLQINVDGSVGTVKTVGSGRVMIDFNHPLSGKDLTYTFTIKGIVSDDAKKVTAYLKHMGLDNLDITTKDGIVNVALHMDVPAEISEQFSKRIKEVIPSLKEVTFSVKKGTEKQANQGQAHSHEGHDHSHDHGHEHGHSHTHKGHHH